MERWLKEAFGGDIIQNFDNKPTDGTIMFATLGKTEKILN